MPSFRLLALLSVLAPLTLLAQGTLTPPGAPAPTMKSLTDIDAKLTAVQSAVGATASRIPVSTLSGSASYQYIISAPGSYFLSGNIAGVAGKAGILISANNVTLDLNGQRLDGTGAVGFGIVLASGVRSARISNGSLSGWSTVGAIATENSANLSFSDLVISGCPTGIQAPGATVSRVQVEGANVAGILAGAVHACIVAQAESLSGDLTGITGQAVRNCRVSGLTAQAGSLTAITAEVAAECEVAGCTGSGSVTGISAPGGRIAGCRVFGLSSSTADVAGLRAEEVSHSGVTQLAATLQASGINATTVTAVTVENLSVSTGPNLFGIVAATVNGARVKVLSGPTTTAAIGIQADNASDCVVESVSAGYYHGFYNPIGMGTFRGCTVLNCGNPASGSGGIGILGSVVVASQVKDLSGGILVGVRAKSVSDVSVRNIVPTAAASVVYGIDAETIRGCTVAQISGPGPCWAIRGQVVHSSQVSEIQSNGVSTGFSVGIYARAVTDCTVDSCYFGLSAEPWCIVANSAQGCVVRFINSQGTGGAAGVCANSVLNCTVNSITHTTQSTTGIICTPGDQFGAIFEGGMVTNCTVNGCRSGIQASNGGRIVGNSCTGTKSAGAFGGIGIGTSGRATVSDNTIRDYQWGCLISSGTGTIVRNTAIDCTTGYTITGTNRVGAVLPGGGAVTDPMANFEL